MTPESGTGGASDAGSPGIDLLTFLLQRTETGTIDELYDHDVPGWIREWVHGGDPGRAVPSGLGRSLGTQAGELLRDCGRVTLGGQAYQVIIPDGSRPGDPVYLRREDGRVFAARLEARIRQADPGEAGPDVGL